MSGMKWRKLRIAWSVMWGVLAVLLCALWVRSYFVSDTLSAPVWHYGGGGCCSRGTIGFWIDDVPDGTREFSHFTEPDGRSTLYRWGDMLDQANVMIDYVVIDDEGTGYLVVRCWVPPVLAAIAAALAWFRYDRFSLRTLLIATTLVAVLLGAIVWAVK
jgi:hypothetical protein